MPKVVKIKELKIEWCWDKTEEKFYQSLCIGKTLHVCCGKSKLGDIRVDIKPQDEGVLKMDYRHLEFPDMSFDTVICDPPWAKTEAVDKGLRWISELRRVAKKRIIIIHHHFFTLRNFVLKKAYVVKSNDAIMWKVVGIYDRVENPLSEAFV